MGSWHKFRECNLLVEVANTWYSHGATTPSSRPNLHAKSTDQCSKQDKLNLFNMAAGTFNCNLTNCCPLSSISYSGSVHKSVTKLVRSIFKVEKKRDTNKDDTKALVALNRCLLIGNTIKVTCAKPTCGFANWHKELLKRHGFGHCISPIT